MRPLLLSVKSKVSLGSLLILLLSTGACSSNPPKPIGESVTNASNSSGADPKFNWDGNTRTDPEPIEKRVRNIGERFSVTWAGGLFGDRDIPGPNAVWIQAVIKLNDSEAARRLVAEVVDHSTTVVPETILAHGLLPEGAAVTSTALNRYVSVDSNTITAYLYQKQEILYVRYFRG